MSTVPQANWFVAREVYSDAQGIETDVGRIKSNQSEICNRKHGLSMVKHVSNEMSGGKSIHPCLDFVESDADMPFHNRQYCDDSA